MKLTANSDAGFVPKLAQTVEINGSGDIYVDGEPFPWYLDGGRIRAEIAQRGLSYIYLPLVVKGRVEFVSHPSHP